MVKKLITRLALLKLCSMWIWRHAVLRQCCSVFDPLLRTRACLDWISTACFPRALQWMLHPDAIGFHFVMFIVLYDGALASSAVNPLFNQWLGRCALCSDICSSCPSCPDCIGSLRFVFHACSYLGVFLCHLCCCLGPQNDFTSMSNIKLLCEPYRGHKAVWGFGYLKCIYIYMYI